MAYDRVHWLASIYVMLKSSVSVIRNLVRKIEFYDLWQTCKLIPGSCNCGRQTGKHNCLRYLHIINKYIIRSSNFCGWSTMITQHW